MKPSRMLALAIAAVLAAALPAGCGSAATPGSTGTPKAAPQVKPAVIRLGNLPTEDFLPLWAAQQKGVLAKAGLDVRIIPFQSAQERDAAFTAGAVDGYMGDIIAAAQLDDAGFKNRIVTVCLGATAKEGRFGIVSSPGSSIRTAKDLAGVPIATSSGTIQEYVVDGLMAEAGIPAAEVKKEEVKKVPVRFELLMNDGLRAAALPEPFLSLAVKQGAHLILDDTKGTNLSQTVLVLSQNFLAKPAGAEAATRLLGAWDEGAKLVNADPNAFRKLLVDNARLPQPVAASYQINTYPMHQLPTKAEVDAVLKWMRAKNLLMGSVVYQDLIWAPGTAVETFVSPSDVIKSSAPSSPGAASTPPTTTAP
jgi:NitT/TauT family transport system substrate-binding protein